MGKWLSVYGESIYGTKAGYMKPQEWGCITQKGNKMYVHVLKNAETIINLPNFPNKKITKAYLLKDKSAVKASLNNQNVQLTIDPKQTELDEVIVLETTN